jgi:3-oxoacyl-ACP reductase-like protein
LRTGKNVPDKENFMGIFSSIKEKLFGKPAAAAAKVTAAPVAAAAQATSATAAQAVAAAHAAAAAAPPAEPVDVEAVLEAIVKAKGQKLNWRVSIVDLLSALDLPNSFTARKELAGELNMPDVANYGGTAEQNIWLHKAVMKALAENGGKVPKELLK